MSKIYALYKQLKKDNNFTIYLFKSGIFYISIADDAYYLSNKFGFKITKLNDTVSKCGFPVSSIEKYSKLFSIYNIKYQIINIQNEFLNTYNITTNSNIQNNSNDLTSNAKKSNVSNNEIVKLIDKICNVDTERLSVSETYKFIEEIKIEGRFIKYGKI